MWPDRVSNSGPLTYESGAIRLRYGGPARPKDTESRVKILLLVFKSEIKIDLTLKKSNFLFLLLLLNCNN